MPDSINSRVESKRLFAFGRLLPRTERRGRVRVLNGLSEVDEWYLFADIGRASRAGSCGPIAGDRLRRPVTSFRRQVSAIAAALMRLRSNRLSGWQIDSDCRSCVKDRPAPRSRRLRKQDEWEQLLRNHSSKRICQSVLTLQSVLTHDRVPAAPLQTFLTNSTPHPATYAT